MTPRIRVRKSNHSRLKRLVLKLVDCSWHMPGCLIYIAFENKIDIKDLINNTPCTCGLTEAWIRLYYATYLPAKELHKQR
jgi:hypothetical protein